MDRQKIRDDCGSSRGVDFCVVLASKRLAWSSTDLTRARRSGRRVYLGAPANALPRSDKDRWDMVRSAGRMRPGRRAAVSQQDGRRHLPRLERSESQSCVRRRWRVVFGGSEGGTEKRSVDGREALGIRRRIRRRSVASQNGSTVWSRLRSTTRRRVVVRGRSCRGRLLAA